MTCTAKQKKLNDPMKRGKLTDQGGNATWQRLSKERAERGQASAAKNATKSIEIVVRLIVTQNIETIGILI